MRCLRAVFLTLFSLAALSAATLTATYRYRLTALDSRLPESVCEARAALRTLMPQAALEDRTAMFRAFREFYLAAPQKTERLFTPTVEPFSRDIMIWLNKSGDGSASGMAGLLQQRADIRKTLGRWLDCGFSVYAAEGDLYPGLAPATITEFARYLPPDLEGYLWFRAREDAQPVVEDACLQISVEELRKTLTRWEPAAQRYPNLEETPLEVEPHIRWLAWLYFFGVDNTPSYDSSDGRIKPELLDSWRRLATLDRASRYGELARELVARVAAHGGRIEEADSALFERYGFEKEFRNWWRSYRFRMDNPPR
jgi:hypothetical protein